MLKGTLQKKQRGLASWKTRDLLVTAAIGIVFAFVMAGAMNLSTLLMSVLSPPIALMLTMPFSVLTGITALYIVRRPGTALLSEFVTGLVMTPLTVFGFTTIIGRLMEGVFYEIPFLFTRYRRWGWLPMMISMGLSATVSYAMGMVHYGGYNLAPVVVMLGFVGNFVLSAGAGALAKYLVNAIAKAGVLNGFAVGQELQQEI